MRNFINKTHYGFTAVELLICVAFIALLAAITIPRYQQGQTSSEIALAKTDMQNLITGIEAYKVDVGAYPWMNGANSCLAPGPHYTGSSQPTLERLTTPISYLNGTTPFYDPFEADKVYSGSTLEIVSTPSEGQQAPLKQYFYHARNSRNTSTWGQFDTDPLWYFLESAGPDKTHHYMWQPLNAMSTDSELNRATLGKTIYDATNGSISRGSIWEVGGDPQGYGVSMATVINAANSSQVSGWRRY